MILSLFGGAGFRASNFLIIVGFVGITFYLKSQAANQSVPLNAGFNQFVVDGVILLSIFNVLSIFSEWMYLLCLAVLKYLQKRFL